MASALKCDRCGKLFEPGQYRTYKVIKRQRKYILTFNDRPCDLCQDCYDELHDWMRDHTT